MRAGGDGAAPKDAFGAGRYRAFYDADCGLCRWVMGVLLAWDRRHTLTPVALQDEDAADRLLGGMDHQRRMASWHLVTPEGDVQSGGRALTPLLRLLPGGGPLAA